MGIEEGAVERGIEKVGGEREGEGKRIHKVEERK